MKRKQLLEIAAEALERLAYCAEVQTRVLLDAEQRTKDLIVEQNKRQEEQREMLKKLFQNGQVLGDEGDDIIVLDDEPTKH